MRERAGDLHQLALGRGQLAHEGVERELLAIASELGQRPFCAPRLLVAKNPAEAPGLDAEQHVLGDGEIGTHRELLIDDGHAGAARVGRIARRVGAPSSDSVPASGRCAPARICISVLLPAPFSPSTA